MSHVSPHESCEHVAVGSLGGELFDECAGADGRMDASNVAAAAPYDNPDPHEVRLYFCVDDVSF